MFVSYLDDSSYCKNFTTNDDSKSYTSGEAKELFRYLNKITSYIKTKHNIEQLNNTFLGLSWTKSNSLYDRLRKSLNSSMIIMNTFLVSMILSKINHNSLTETDCHNKDENIENLKSLKYPTIVADNKRYTAVNMKKNSILLKLIHIVLISMLLNESLISVSKNLCIDAMRLPEPEFDLSPTSSSFESDSHRVPPLWIDPPVVKFIKTHKDDLGETLQSEKKIRQRVSSIFQDKQAIQNLLREMNAYYLTYGRPRYG
uniref:PRESAN domain-containing protein n=1 Tax=Trichobilharzia regenti TaxID=157069 RepID=A0AA85JBH2_TRIRE|nr:unnamed protein product [Trichobilharzia regenti]